MMGKEMSPEQYRRELWNDTIGAVEQKIVTARELASYVGVRRKAIVDMQKRGVEKVKLETLERYAAAIKEQTEPIPWQEQKKPFTHIPVLTEVQEIKYKMWYDVFKNNTIQHLVDNLGITSHHAKQIRGDGPWRIPYGDLSGYQSRLSKHHPEK